MESTSGFADLKVFITKTTLPSEGESKHRPFVQKGCDCVSIKLFVQSWEKAQIWREVCVSSPDGSDGKESACDAGDPGWARRAKWLRLPESGRSPGGVTAIHSSILARGIHGQRSLVGCSPSGSKQLGTTEQPALSLSLWFANPGLDFFQHLCSFSAQPRQRSSYTDLPSSLFFGNEWMTLMNEAEKDGVAGGVRVGEGTRNGPAPPPIIGVITQSGSNPRSHCAMSRHIFGWRNAAGCGEWRAGMLLNIPPVCRMASTAKNDLTPNINRAETETP